jgi:hypothetical protein
MFWGRNSYLSGAALVLGLVVTGCVSPLHAQFINVEAGASNLVSAQGASISFEGPKFSSYFGAGDLGGVFGMGAYLKTSIGSHQVTLGDQPIIFDLPTDIFNANHFLLTRGIGVTSQREKPIYLFLPEVLPPPAERNSSRRLKWIRTRECSLPTLRSPPTCIFIRRP